MLDGLEAIELKFSEARGNPDFRIDAEFHRKPIAENRSYAYVSVGEILKLIQYGISIDMNEEGDGYKIYRMNEITNMLCNVDVTKYADITQGEATAFMLDNNDVLFNRTNSQEFVGRTGIFKKFSDEPHVFASYLIRLRTDESKVLPEYLTTFFNGKFGLWDIKRRARISINQSNVNAEEIKAIKIPLIGNEIQQYIRRLFESAFAKLLASRAMYAEAESLLLEELGLKDWQPSGEIIAVKSLSESFGSTSRLDAEFYEPRFNELESKLGKVNSRQLLTLIDEDVKRGVQPAFNEGGDVYVIASKAVRPSGVLLDKRECTDKLFYEEKKTSKARLKKGDVLLNGTGRGTLGRASVYDSDSLAIADNHVTIIRVNEELCDPYYLMLYLNSIAGQWQSEKYQCGSSGQLELYPDQIEQFLIYAPPMETSASANLQQRISFMIKESFALREQSKTILNVAKRGVEIAIEQDEAVALAWMDEQTRSMNLS